MKKYIIFPTTQTEGMDGYSNIAIENTPENINDLFRMVSLLYDVRELDPTVSRLVYANAKVDVLLFNDEFEAKHDKIYFEEIDGENVYSFCNEGEFKVNCVEVEVSSYEIKFTYDAEFTDSKVFCSFTLDDINSLYKQNDL